MKRIDWKIHLIKNDGIVTEIIVLQQIYVSKNDLVIYNDNKDYLNEIFLSNNWTILSESVIDKFSLGETDKIIHTFDKDVYLQLLDAYFRQAFRVCCKKNIEFLTKGYKIIQTFVGMNYITLLYDVPENLWNKENKNE